MIKILNIENKENNWGNYIKEGKCIIQEECIYIKFFLSKNWL